MTDEEIMQAVLLALTRQNVTGSGSQDGTAGIIADCLVLTTGYLDSYPPVYGEYGT